MTHKICFSLFDRIPLHCHFSRVFAQVPNFGCNAGAGLHARAVEWMVGRILGMITPAASGDTGKTLQEKHAERLIFILIQRAASSQVTPTLKRDGNKDGKFRVMAGKGGGKQSKR